MIRLRIEVLFGFLLATQSLQAQQTPSSEASQMSAKEAYTYALTPFMQAKQAPDDLTDADKWAIGIGVERARESCSALASKLQEDESLLDEGKLCLLGQDFQTAGMVLKRYVLLKNPANLEDGRLLLAQAFLGLQSVAPAESQMESLLEEFPYDAKIHLGIDHVIDAAEANLATEDVARRLNGQQITHTLEALSNSGTINSNDKSATVSAALLVQDALRSARIDREMSALEAAGKITDVVKQALAAPQYSNTAELPAMQNAFSRYQLVGKKALEVNLRGEKILRTSSIKQVVHLPDRSCVLLPFSLASPQSADIIGKVVNLLKDKPALPIYAVTSFTANNGDEERNDIVLSSLRAFRGQLPANVTILVIPDVELQMFNIDSYPSGVVLSKDGIVRFVEPLSGGKGGLRRLVAAAK